MLVHFQQFFFRVRRQEFASNSDKLFTLRVLVLCRNRQEKREKMDINGEEGRLKYRCKHRTSSFVE